MMFENERRTTRSAEGSGKMFFLNYLPAGTKKTHLLHFLRRLCQPSLSHEAGRITTTLHWNAKQVQE
jgi:hypothetical protein